MEKIPRKNGRGRGQLSMDALVSFWAMLAAFAVLFFCAQRLSEDFYAGVSSAAGRQSLAYSALCLDTAAQGVPDTEADAAPALAVRKGGTAISLPGSGAEEPLFHRAYSDSGGRLHVQSDSAEKA